MAPTSYKGTLAAKRKAEVIEIADAMGLSVTDEQTKASIDDEIRTKLASSTRLQGDDRFVGLWHSMNSSRGGRQSSVILPTSPTNAAERVISTGTSVVDKVLNAVNDASEKAIVTADRRTHQLVGSPGAQLARRVSRRSSQLFNEVGHTIGSAQGAVEQVAVVAQDRLSNAWVLIGVTVLFELFLLLATEAALSHKLRVGPFKSFLLRRDVIWEIRLPDWLSLGSFSYWAPIALWATFTVAVPALMSKLIVFGEPAPTGRRSKRHLAPASPMTFAIIRLVVVYYLSKVAPTPLIKLPQDVAAHFGDVQLLSAATGAAFAAYELIAGDA